MQFLNVFELSGIDKMNKNEFRNYILNILKKQGFQVTIPSNNIDLGIDFIAQKGESKYAVHISQQTGLVSKTDINNVDRDKHKYYCDKAMVVSKYYFDKDAIDLSISTQCELIDKDKLAEWIYNYR